MGQTSAQALGRYGEDLAEQQLLAAGLVVLDRNWRCPTGELDLVARDRDGTLVFVETSVRTGGWASACDGAAVLIEAVLVSR